MLYSNPIDLHQDENLDFGDPFVFRFDGDYYLFHTAHVPLGKMRVYKSHNLIDWKYLGYACEDEKGIGAFAPEIIYAYNAFYLCTSPLGKGHYIFKSDKPEGPYQRISDNIGSMIDGSFFLTNDAKLHFLRANHEGISLFDMDEDGGISNRRNIPVQMGAWTEGPSLIYYRGLYYLFYTGNNYVTKGYHSNYAFSTNWDGPYQMGLNEPLLIDADDEDTTRLGHPCEVLSPDLLSYQMVYHAMEFNAQGKRKPRKILFDRLQISGNMVAIHPTDYSISTLAKPTFEAYRNDFRQKNGFFLSNKKTSSHFVLEAVLSTVSLVLSYKNNNDFITISFLRRKITITRFSAKGHQAILSLPIYFDFQYPHQIRIENLDNGASLFIDATPIAKFSSFQPGYVGYQSQKGDTGFDYLSFTNTELENPNSLFEVPLPNLLTASNAFSSSRKIRKNKNYNYCYSLGANDYLSFRYSTKVSALYFLSAFCHVAENTVLLIRGKRVRLTFQKQDYDFNILFLGAFPLERHGVLTLRVITGSLDLTALSVEKKALYQPVNFFTQKEASLLSLGRQNDYYLLKEQDGYFSHFSFDFIGEEFLPFESFGLLINARNYSQEDNQGRYHLNAVMVGVCGKLLSLDLFKYRKIHVYDRPYDFKPNTSYHVEIERENNHYRVSLNGSPLIDTFIETLVNTGRVGFYASVSSRVSFSHLRIDGREVS